MSETTSETRSELETCEGCVALPQLRREIRQLTEKLEYSQLQNSLLHSECDRLRSQLREAEFKGRSSIKSSSYPLLPNEVLRHIFFLATYFEGLVFPRWDNVAEPNWKLSSLTRRTIPLVCRKWHMIGLEFLFEHVALRRTQQISDILSLLNTHAYAQRWGRIRRLEFSVRKDASGFGFLSMAQNLVQSLREGQLRAFVVDFGSCDGYLTATIGAILVSVLGKSGNRLETLHLSCMAHSEQILATQNGLVGDEPQVLEALSTTLSQLDTLSLQSGFFNMCSASCFTRTGEILLNGIKASASAIRTLLINTIGIVNKEQLLGFLEGLVYLETVQIVSSAHFNIIANNLDRFFMAVPRLKRLTLTPMPYNPASGDPPILDNSKADETSHLSLEEITVHLNTPKSHVWIFCFAPFLRKIKLGNFPNLQRIIIHGNHPNGCLDGDQIFERVGFDLWADAIECCTKRDIAIVSQTGHPIHLWSIRHGIILDAVELVNDSSSDDEEWYERNDTTSPPESECTNSHISDDEDDGPYQYLHQPDIEQVVPDSE